jgi:hypothetical protein
VLFAYFADKFVVLENQLSTLSLLANRPESQVKTSLSRRRGEPGVETKEVGGEASFSQIQGEEDAYGVGKHINIGKCSILRHALEKFQTHAHYKKPNAHLHLRRPLRIDVSKPEREDHISDDV